MSHSGALLGTKTSWIRLELEVDLVRGLGQIKNTVFSCTQTTLDVEYY